MIVSDLNSILDEIVKLISSARKDRHHTESLLKTARLLTIKLNASITATLEELPHETKYTDKCGICQKETKSYHLKAPLGSYSSIDLCEECFNLEMRLRRCLNKNLPHHMKFSIYKFDHSKNESNRDFS